MLNNKFIILDGNAEEQQKIVNDFLSTLTEKEKEEVMSSKYDYLDD